MGRWTDKIANVTNGELTKLTKPSSVSFVSGTHGTLSNNCMVELKFSCTDFLNAVNLICDELNIDASSVITDLLAIEDEQDFIDGYLSVDQLRGFIKLWMKGR